MKRTWLAALFRLSDALAWLLFIVAAYTAVAVPFIEIAPRTGVGIPTNVPFYFSLPWVAVAFGAFHLTRRHPFGLLLAMLLPFAGGFFSNLVATVSYELFALLVFGLPLMLAFLEARQKARHVAS